MNYGRYFELQKQKLLLVNGKRSEIFDELKQSQINHILAGANSWDRVITAEDAQFVKNKYFPNTYEQFGELFDFDVTDHIKVKEEKNHMVTELADDFEHPSLKRLE